MPSYEDVCNSERDFDSTLNAPGEIEQVSWMPCPSLDDQKGKDALSCALKETTASVASEGRGKVLEHTLSFSMLHHHSFCLLLAAKGFVAHRDD